MSQHLQPSASHPHSQTHSQTHIDPQRPSGTHCLERLLVDLQSIENAWQGHPELLIVHSPPSFGSENCSKADRAVDCASDTATDTSTDTATTIEIRPLLGINPIAEMIGIESSEHWWAIGVRAPALSRRLRDDELQGSLLARPDAKPCAFVHLINRSGTSLTELSVPGSESIRLGPDRTLREGRIADACRRVFALPTADPPDMAEFVIDAWLTLVLRAALVTPGLDWPGVVRLSPAHQISTIGNYSTSSASMSPAELARALQDTAESLDWARYRDACIALGGCPVSDLTPAEITWMDTGMFARWAQNALPRAADLLDLLEPTLDPVAHDRLWATVSLAERRVSSPFRH